MIDASLKNIYDYKKYSPTFMRVKNSKKSNKYRRSLSNYKFGFLIDGDDFNRELMLTCSYMDDKESESSFILDGEDIDYLVDKLQEMKSIINKGKHSQDILKGFHNTLNEYIDAGYIELIEMRRNDTLLPPGYNPALYMAFIIRPRFKLGIDIPSEVNTAFNFLEVLHLDINENEYDKTMNYIRNYHDIPIVIYGWDRDAEIEKRKKEALKDADKRIKEMNDGTKEERDKKYRKILNDMFGIPTAMMTDDAIRKSVNDMLKKK